MQTRTPRWDQLLVPGLCVALCVGLLLFAWRSFGGNTPLYPKGYQLSVPLPEGTGLFPGADVRAAGVTIGEVRDVEQDGVGAVALIELEPRFVPMRQGTRALLRTKTLLGEGFLEIAPGPRDRPEIPDGGSLARSDVLARQRLDDVLETFEPRTRMRLRLLAHGLAGAFRGRAADVNETLGSAAPAWGGLDAVLAVLDEESDSLQRIMAGSGDVFAALGRRQGSLRAAIRNADKVLTATSRRDRQLTRIVRALPPFVADLGRAADELTAANEDLAPAAAGLSAVGARVPSALDAVEATAPDFRRVFERLPATLDAADRGLPKLRSILRSAEPAFDGIHPALREMLPVLELLALVRDSAVTTFANVAQIHNGTYVGPDNRVLHYANGLITLWNESIGGWVKRLPSNRGNTYPDPSFLEDFARTGLKSFDCRHVDNSPVLPPFGAAPPCLTQGPWTFKGKTRYYPHLEPAPP